MLVQKRASGHRVTRSLTPSVIPLPSRVDPDMLGAAAHEPPVEGRPPQGDEDQRAGCALLSLLACQSSQASRANEGASAGTMPALPSTTPSAPPHLDNKGRGAVVPHEPRMPLGIDMPPIPPMMPMMPSDPHDVVWIIERRGLHLQEPWSQLPRSIRPKAKLPGFLRRGGSCSK